MSLIFTFSPSPFSLTLYIYDDHPRSLWMYKGAATLGIKRKWKGMTEMKGLNDESHLQKAGSDSTWVAPEALRPTSLQLQISHGERASYFL